MDTRVLIGGTSLVLLTGAAAAIQVTAPELLPVLCPLSLMVGSTAYLVARPDVRARVAGLLPAPPARALPDHTRSVTAPIIVPDPDTQAQVLEALAQPTHPAMPVASPPPAHDVGLLDTLLTATPPPAPRPAVLPLDYAPGMAERWIATMMPLHVLEAAVAHPALTPRALTQRLHEMLVRGSLTVSRVTLGCAMHEADQLGDWTAALVICDRAPDATLYQRLQAHFLALALQPYSRGGTAILVVLAPPASVATDARPSTPPADVTQKVSGHTNTDTVPVRSDAEGDRVVVMRTTTAQPLVRATVLDDDVAMPADEDDLPSADARGFVATEGRPRHQEDAANTQLGDDDDDKDGRTDTAYREDESTAIVPVPPSSRAGSIDLVPARAVNVPAVPAPDSFLAHERPPQPVAPQPQADLATARAIWTPGANLPQLHFGVHPHTGELITGSLEPTCLFVPSQRGKTTLLMYLLHQALLAYDPATGEGIAPWFMTTKWQETTMHGVQIGRWLRRSYNLAHFDAPSGLEPDGTGTYRLLRLLERELHARLTPGTARARTPIMVMLDEWAYTVAVLEQKRFKQDSRRKKVSDAADEGAFDPLALEDETPKTPLAAASLAARRLIRQGFGERMVLFLATQDGQVQNNGEILNTGVLGSFSTYLCHTECDAATFKIISKGDTTRLNALQALRRDWQGWIYVREHQVLPLTFPHVTNTTIDQWLAELPAPARAKKTYQVPVPSTVEPAASVPASTLVGSTVSHAWPESVRSYIDKLPPAQLRAIIAACAQCGVKIPVRTSEAQRLALLGLGAPEEANQRFVALLRALATKANPLSLNQLAALMFGSTGRTTAEVGRAVRTYGQE